MTRFLVFLSLIFLSFSSLAEEKSEKIGVLDNFKIEKSTYGKPVDWQLNFQKPASPVMEKLVNLHDGLLYMVFGISIFVLLLLLYVMFRFREKANPTPSKTTHNTLIEIIWTAVPVLILVAIVIPSWRLINYMEKHENPELTIKAIGYQWYWGYEYVDGVGKGIKFESYMTPEDKLKKGEPRLLKTDNAVVLPVDTNIRVLTTAADVIHAWAVPSFGVKKDAVPGRINETWVRITKEGTYYGQCSELCGSKHAFMPIEVKAVSKKAYRKWAKKQLNG
ncbi:MAG: cytochrome c oxidase subunit II [Rickettsiales bacterium]|nr:cytochrome c oxidase subunit II [Rickettsiales bacterium]